MPAQIPPQEGSVGHLLLIYMDSAPRAHENLARSPIFKQQNIHTTNNLDDFCFSLKK
jgi:hypothetical protein